MGSLLDIVGPEIEGGGREAEAAGAIDTSCAEGRP
jgi:hypothetical protein